MVRVLACVPAALLIVLCCLSFGEPPLATACPGSNDADLNGPVSVPWDENDEVEFVLEAGWATLGTPFIGVLEELETPFVTNVVYSPLYFFPDSCTSGDSPVEITVTAEKEQHSTVGYALNTRLNVGPSPNNANAAHVVSIYD